MSKKYLILNVGLILAAVVLAKCTQEGVTTEAPASPTVELTQSEEPVLTEQAIETVEPTEVVAEIQPAKITGTITLWHAWNEFEMESLVEVLAAFQEQYPDVQFDVMYVPFDDLRGKFEAAAATGGGPTVLIGAADWGPAFYDKTLVADLTDRVSEDLLATINPAALGAVQYKDAMIGLPHEINKGVVMFRNTSILTEAPTTWADLLESAQAATHGDVIGADLESGLYFSAGHLNACGGKLMEDNGDPAFNNEAGVCWLNLFTEYDATGLPGENNTDNDVNLFKEGKAGIIIDGTWNSSSLAEAIGAENLSIDPWPATDQGALSGYVQTENLYLSANATEDDAAAGLAFIEFFLSPETQAILADPTKAAHIPAITGEEITDPLIQAAVIALEGGTRFPLIPEMNAYWDPLNNAILSVINEGTEPAAALQKAEDEVNGKLEEIRGGG